MKKVISFLLLCFVVVGVAWADSFTPVSGVSAYLIKNKKNNNFATYNANSRLNANDATNILTATANCTFQSFFKIEASGDYFTIRLASDDTKYVYAVNKNDANSNVGVKEVTGDPTDDCLWTITTYSDGYNIKPKGGSNGWNNRGGYNGISHIGQWENNTTNDNTWYITGSVAMLPTEQTIPAEFENTDAIGLPARPRVAYSTLTPFVNALDAEFNQTNYDALISAITNYNNGLANVYLPTGIYKIKAQHKDVNCYGYNDYFMEGNGVGATFFKNPANGSYNNQYYWKITRSGNSITILNGEGTPICKSSGGNWNDQKFFKYNSLALLPYNASYYTTSAGVNFEQNLHVTAQDHFKKDGACFITTWGGREQAENRFMFEAIDDNYEAYTVSITGKVDYLTEVPYVSHASTNQKALHGGFMVFNAVPNASDFSYPSECYDAAFAVNAQNKTITLTLTPNVARTFAYLKTMANSLLTGTENKVGYPKAGPRATLQAAINTAAGVTTATQTDLNALASAIQNYKRSKDVNLPENGKVYTIKLRRTDGPLLYLYRQDNSSANLRVEAYRDGMSLPNEAYFVCRYNESSNSTYKYSFVPAYSAGYLCYNCFNTGTYNGITPSNSGKPINDAKIQPLVGQTSNSNISDRSVNNLFGYLYMTFDDRTASKDWEGCITLKEENFAFDNSTSPYLNGTLTSALVFEEVPYPNNVTLNPAVGIDAGNQNIATFSAPFATVVPEGVTAYVVYEAGNTAKMAQFATTGQAIPANTGVLLYGTATNALMVPATSETQASIADGQSNKLIGTAGAAKNMEDVAGAYILGKPADADKVAFYLCSGGTLGMNKAYLDLSTSGAAALEIDFGGEATGLTNLNIATEKTSPIYDLSGRRVMNVQKGGLYIQNGKKFIVK